MMGTTGRGRYNLGMVWRKLFEDARARVAAGGGRVFVGVVVAVGVGVAGEAGGQENNCPAVIHKTECMSECPSGFAATTQNRVCVGNSSLGDANKCEAKGWKAALVSDLDISICLIKTRDAGGSGGSTDHCTLGSNCLGFFGPDSDFPQRPADDPATAEDESDPRYVFKCDFDGSTGHLPARFADGRTMCECPAGRGGGRGRRLRVSGGNRFAGGGLPCRHAGKQMQGGGVDGVG